MVELMFDDDAVGIVAFGTNATELEQLTTLGAGGREHAKDVIAGSGLTPSGATSIGAGIAAGLKLFAAPGPQYAARSLVVLTDGIENTAPWIADVAPAVAAAAGGVQMYAVGLGTPQNISTSALQTLSGNNGGYLLLTGAIAGDNAFLLQKYFLQILADISDAQIVLDPQGTLVAGAEQRIPFRLTESDRAVDVILLTADPELVDFRVEAPGGASITEQLASVDPSVSHVSAAGVAYFRFTLPAELAQPRAQHGGLWRAVLRLREPDRDGGKTAAPRRRTVPYSLLVHSHSDIALETSVEQSRFDPGAVIALHASLAASGRPARSGAQVWAHVTRPDGTIARVELAEQDPSRFTGTFATTIPGVYGVRMRAMGRSAKLFSFQRERTLTAGVWRGAGAAPPHAASVPRRGWRPLRCLRWIWMWMWRSRAGGRPAPRLR
jgi:hypothetical protein